MKKLLLYTLLISILLAGCMQTPANTDNRDENIAGTDNFFDKEKATIIVIPSATGDPTEPPASDVSFSSETASLESTPNSPAEYPEDSYSDGVPVPEKPN